MESTSGCVIGQRPIGVLFTVTSFLPRTETPGVIHRPERPVSALLRARWVDEALDRSRRKERSR